MDSVLAFIKVFVVSGVIPLFAYFIYLIPVKIAEIRGITDKRLRVIKWLSFLGLVFIVPWWIAFYLALDDNESLDEKVFDNNSEYSDYELHHLDNTPVISADNLDKLEKINSLKEKGILTEEEFNTQKEILLYRKETNLSTISYNYEDKSMGEYFSECYDKKYWWDTDGRARRKEYWGFMLYSFMLNIVAQYVFIGMIINNPSNHKLYYFAYAIIYLVQFPAFLGVSVRRLHDINLSGLWMIIPISLIIAVNFQVVLPYLTNTDGKLYDVNLPVWSIFIPIISIIIGSIKSNMMENRYGLAPEGV